MQSLVKIENLSVEFPIKGGLLGKQIGAVRAVQDVSFEIKKGETLGLVGESGCGKSTLGKALLRLIKTKSGAVYFENENLLSIEKSSLQQKRRKLQIIFQDPFSSLNPRMRVGQILAEPFKIHRICSQAEIPKKVFELLEIVGLRKESYDKFPHEFSGGQRQRIGIARALAVRPEFIVADEPVSALDVSIQSQILNLLRSLQKDFQLTYLFISHDLNVIRYLCDRIIVMYLGRVMEILTKDELLDPNFKKHPYTSALIASAPKRHPQEVRSSPILKGDIPSPANPPCGCVFHSRCPEAQESCRVEIPALRSSEARKGSVACHLRN